MRAATVLVVCALLVACGDDEVAPRPTPQPTTPQQQSIPATPVSPPDAIARLAASFTADLLVRQSKNVGLGAAACRDLAGQAGCIQLLSAGGACSQRFVPGRGADEPDGFLAECVGGANGWQCSVQLQFYPDGERAGQAAYRDDCPPPDAASQERLDALLEVARTWEMVTSGS